MFPGTFFEVSLFVGSQAKNLNTGVNVNNNVWVHAVWTISPSGDWTVYLDGSIVAAQSGLTYPTAISRLSNNLGKSNWGSDPYFNGAMRDFRIYGGGGFPIHMHVSNSDHFSLGFDLFPDFFISSSRVSVRTSFEHCAHWDSFHFIVRLIGTACQPFLYRTVNPSLFLLSFLSFYFKQPDHSIGNSLFWSSTLNTFAKRTTSGVQHTILEFKVPFGVRYTAPQR